MCNSDSDHLYRNNLALTLKSLVPSLEQRVPQVVNRLILAVFHLCCLGSLSYKLQRQSLFGEDQHGGGTESAEISCLLYCWRLFCGWKSKQTQHHCKNI